MVMELQEKAFIELEGARELLPELPRGINELCEHRRDLSRVTSQETTSVQEFVTKRQPLLLY